MKLQMQKQNNDGEDLGDHIIVKFLVNDGQPSNPSDDHEIVWKQNYHN